MPIIYRRPPQPLSPEPALVTDADDSIVLSDLVRSAEASRLRRRGAIAIRESPLTSTPGIPYTLPAPSIAVTAVPAPASPWDSPANQLDEDPVYDDDEDENDEQGGEWDWARRAAPGTDMNDGNGNESLERDVRRMALEAEIRLEDADEGSPAHMLFCGGDISADDLFDPPSSCTSTSAPLRRRASAFCPPSPSRRPTATRARRSNGCGALVHVGALPRRRHGVWIARGVASEAVVGMDANYFDCRAVAKMMKSACGCVREGVGCRVWYVPMDCCSARY